MDRQEGGAEQTKRINKRKNVDGEKAQPTKKQILSEKGPESSLFPLLHVAEQQRRAQEKPTTELIKPQDKTHINYNIDNNMYNQKQANYLPLPRFHVPQERLIAFTTAATEFPRLRPVPLSELSSLKIFCQWVKRTFDLKDDNFVLVDRSVEDRNGEDGGIIFDDAKLANAKEIEIVEVSREEYERLMGLDSALSLQMKPYGDEDVSAMSTDNEEDLLLHAKNIILFLANKGNPEAQNLIYASPGAFSSVSSALLGSPAVSSSIANAPSSPLSLERDVNSTPMLNISNPSLPRILIQTPSCLIPGYYIFSPVFDSFGEKRKLPIKIELPRSMVFASGHYRTVSTYIGLGPYGNDPNSYVKLEGDHLVGTVALRQDDDDEGASSVCVYVFKNLRLKTRSLIRTVLDVHYSGMRTGRFFFQVDEEVLPTTSRKFEIKAPSGYTIKMVNKSAKSNPIAKHGPNLSNSVPSLPVTIAEHNHRLAFSV